MSIQDERNYDIGFADGRRSVMEVLREIREHLADNDVDGAYRIADVALTRGGVPERGATKLKS